IDDAVAKAKADGMPALALTDASNVFGMVKFYTAARAAGVKPLVGVDCWLQNESDRDKPHRLLLLCSSRAGFLRLSELLSRAWLRNQHRSRAATPRRPRSWPRSGRSFFPGATTSKYSARARPKASSSWAPRSRWR